jgi:hypothetical protein
MESKEAIKARLRKEITPQLLKKQYKKKYPVITATLLSTTAVALFLWIWKKEACDIKGNISETGVRLYHKPNDPHYDSVKITPYDGEQWFCSEKEAIKAGWESAITPELEKTFD